jgi:hypothetical protein
MSSAEHRLGSALLVRIGFTLRAERAGEAAQLAEALLRGQSIEGTPMMLKPPST